MKKLLRLIILSIFLTSTVNVIAQTVFKSKTESKYHLISCKFLDQKHDSLDLSIALKKGYSPCDVCEPPTKIGEVKKSNASMDMGKSEPKQQMNSSIGTAFKQCVFIDKDGKRCPGEAEKGSKYCLVHMKKN